MRVLLTNDDGIRAPGIIALHHALRNNVEFAREVFPVAPETVQSATSHCVTFHEPLMVRAVEVTPHMAGIAVDGRPVDCVKLAFAALWAERFGTGSRPDLVLSGMNAGANIGVNVIYSGTVAAAIEGAFFGVPSIAVSLHLGAGIPDYPRAARRACGAVEWILETGLLGPHCCLTVNIPITEKGRGDEHEMPEIVVCPVNTHALNDHYERRVSPAGEVYYWPTGSGLDFQATDPGCDVSWLLKGKITVTPLGNQLTDGPQMERWRDCL